MRVSVQVGGVCGVQRVPCKGQGGDLGEAGGVYQLAYGLLQDYDAAGQWQVCTARKHRPAQLLI